MVSDYCLFYQRAEGERKYRHALFGINAVEENT
jgi:hypothetical protein